MSTRSPASVQLGGEGRRVAVLNMQDDRGTWTLPTWAPTEIAQALGPGWELRHVTEPVSGRGDGGGAGTEALAAVSGAEVIFALGLPRELLQAALQPQGTLRWIHSGTAGVRSLLHPELLDSDVVLTNSAGIHAPPMAESVIGMILHFARGFDHAVRAQARREWGKHPFEHLPDTAREITGATLGIVGLGGIGREIAWRALGLDMEVLAVRRRSRPQAASGVTMLHGEDALPQLLARSDYVAIAVPSTSETRGMIGALQLAAMKPGAVLLNVSRGDVVDEPALERALRTGHLRGAALDVFREEPLPKQSALWDLENVLITPHVSATTPRFWRREVDLIVDNIARYQEHRPLRNLVDKAAGY
ncbi:MAG TPA: D-2-hydroxyacid dehydrogenase [Longimicrobiales bacterium]|nr:D-2-hydroxyacid dehydrogenase [Longimicrobiales bacterium]